MATNEAAKTAAAQPTTPKAHGGGRSVNYPFITLGEAVKKAKALWEHVGKNRVPIPTAAPFWGYGEKSSGVRSTVSALKQYGLIIDEGAGDERQIRLSDRGMDLVIDATDPQKREISLRKAVLTPKIYQEILSRFPEGLPSADSAIASFLLREKDFNRKAVDSFIADFRANMKLANITSSANMPPLKDAEADDEDGITVNSGDYVQWESGGVLQFEQPRRVLRVTDDGKFVFVEGSNTGLPVGEVRMVNAPAVQNNISALATPAFSTTRDAAEFQQDTYTLGKNEGRIILQWPEKMTQESYDEFAEWIDLQMRKIAQ